jgi:hypothetical protein
MSSNVPLDPKDDSELFDSRHAVSKSPYVDPLQIRCAELMAEQRRIGAELADLKRQMTIGHCDVCGDAFRRTRFTKRYCSQKCTMKASQGVRATYDLPLVREVWPILRESGMLAPQSIEILSRLVDGGTTTITANAAGISHQRVSQIAHRATKMARLIRLIQLSTTTDVTRRYEREGQSQ